MHDIFLIRHSITEGNLQKRYIGMTDEPLCEEGILLLKQIRQRRKQKEADHVYTQSAEAVYRDGKMALS